MGPAHHPDPNDVEGSIRTSPPRLSPTSPGHDPEPAGEVIHLLGVLEDEVQLLGDQVPQLAAKLSPVLIHYPEGGDTPGDQHDANTEVGSRLARLCAQVHTLTGALSELRHRTEL